MFSVHIEIQQAQLSAFSAPDTCVADCRPLCCGLPLILITWDWVPSPDTWVCRVRYTGIIGLEFLSLCATVMKIASTWFAFSSSLAEVSNRGMLWESANFCARLVFTAIFSFISHLLPTRIRGISLFRLCWSHSSIHWDMFSKEFILVTSYTNITACTFR